MLQIGIVGYGKLGRGVIQALDQQPDMELAALFSRRVIDHPLYRPWTSISKDCVDVLILCGGSATDLPKQGPQAAEQVHTVDSFDTHANIPAYFAAVDKAARTSGHLSLISTGWDPGLFSIQRLVMEATLPVGDTSTFWGPGVSQGHSDAIRRIPGVLAAAQYTLPDEEAVTAVRNGQGRDLTPQTMHTRLCYVVAADSANKEAIRQAICTMPNYFAGYKTEVQFVTQETFDAQHAQLPHGGRIIRRGVSSDGHAHQIEFSLQLESNPAFTALLAVCGARAVGRMAHEGRTGAVTVFDIPPAYYSVLSPEEQRKRLL